MSAGGHNVIADLIHQPISSWEEFETIYEYAQLTVYTNMFISLTYSSVPLQHCLENT